MGSANLVDKNKNKIFNIVLIIISIVVALNIYKKQVMKINSLKANIVEEEKKNKALDNFGKLDAKVDSYRRLLPRKETNTYINDINNIARSSGVVIMSIKPSGEESSPEYTKYIFDLMITSSDYDKLAKFINSLEVNQTVYMIDVLDIRSSSYNKEKELSANLRVSALAILE